MNEINTNSSPEYGREDNRPFYDHNYAADGTPKYTHAPSQQQKNWYTVHEWKLLDEIGVSQLVQDNPYGNASLGSDIATVAPGTDLYSFRTRMGSYWVTRTVKADNTGVYGSTDGKGTITPFVTWTSRDELEKKIPVVWVALDQNAPYVFNPGPKVYGRYEPDFKFIGSDAGNTMTGNGGNNTFSGGKSADFVDTKGGNNLVYANAGNDTVYGGTGNDTVFGGAGRDFIAGDGGSNTLIAGGDDDIIVSGHTTDYQGTKNAPTDMIVTGRGADIVILGNVPLKPDTNKNNKLQKLADAVKEVAPDVVDLALKAGGMPLPLVNVTKTLGEFMKAVASDSKQYAQPDKYQPTVIKDFNPLEDKIMIPLASGLTNIEIQDSSGQNVVKIVDKTGGNIQVLAEIQLAPLDEIIGEGAGRTVNDATFKQAIIAQIKQSLAVIEDKKITYSSELTIKTPGKEDKGYDVGENISTSFDSLGLGDKKYALIGAWSGRSTSLDGGGKLTGTNLGDVLYGYNPNISGGGENLPTSSKAEMFYGFGGDDLVVTGDGNDTVFGGTGSDTVSYEKAGGGYASGGGIKVDFTKLKTDDSGLGRNYITVEQIRHISENNKPTYTDNLYSVENIIGTKYGDDLFGDNGANMFAGRNGNDTLKGGGGDDTLLPGDGVNSIEGGAGNDTISYRDLKVKVDVDLNRGTTLKTTGTDTFTSVENVIGSDAGDKITGNHLYQKLEGGKGNDEIYGMGGDDTIYGGDGNDTLDGGAWADLLYGGKGDDSLIGGDGWNRMYGEDGNDTLDGTGGQWGVKQTLDGGKGNDSILGGDAHDSINGGADNDIIRSGKGNDTIDGGAGDDQIFVDGDQNDVTLGSGKDWITFNGGNAVVRDWNNAEDKFSINYGAYGNSNTYKTVDFNGGFYLEVGGQRIGTFYVSYSNSSQSEDTSANISSSSTTAGKLNHSGQSLAVESPDNEIIQSSIWRSSDYDLY